MKSNHARHEALAFGKNEGARAPLAKALLIGSAMVALCSVPAAGQTLYTFTGAGTTNNWSEAANWNGSTIPVSGNSIVQIAQTGAHTPSSLDLNLTLTQLRLYSTTDATVLAGGYTITPTGTNKLTLSNSGGVTTIQDSTTNTALNVFNMAITQTDANAILLEGNSAGDLFNGVIDGAGSLTVQNSGGQVILAAENTYTGGTHITSGSLQLGNGGATGSVAGAVNLEVGTNLVLDHSGNFTFANNVGGGGRLVNSGSGTTFVTGTNTYSGGTLIEGGKVSVDSVARLGTGGISLANGGALQITTGETVSRSLTLGTGGGALDISGMNTVTWTSAFANIATGALTKAGTGTLVFTTNQTYGKTTIAAGTLQLGNGGAAGSVNDDIVDNGTLVFNRSDATSFTYAISGSGSVVKNGANTLTLTSANGYSGGTTINSGVLSVSADANLGNSAGAVSIQDGATLQMTYGFSTGRNISLAGTATIDTLASGGSTYIINGTISGLGALNKTSGGYLILTANNTYSGGTTVNDGILQLGNGGTTGSVQGDIALTSTTAKLWVSRSNDLTLSGTISGPGGMSVMGGGTLTLTADNTLTGTTMISAGKLQLGNGGTTGTVGGNISLAGASSWIVFNHGSGTQTFSHNISGNGSMEKLGSGTLVLTGTNFLAAGNSDPTAGIYVRGGMLQLGDGSTAGSLSGNIFLSNHSQIVVDLPALATTTIANVTGAGSLEVASGKLILTGVNTYSEGSTIDSGATLQVGQGGTGVAIAGDIADAGHLVFNVSDTLTVTGAITGNGTVANSGPATGRVVLTGANTYSGGTTIASGTLQIGDGGTAGSIVGDVADSGTLAFDHSDDITFGGVISDSTTGNGAVAQIGSGVLTLTGNNTYSGGTKILNGTLSVAGSSNLGSGAIAIAEHAVLQVTANSTFSNNIVLDTTKTGGFNGGTIDVAGVTTKVRLNGVISSADDPASLGGAYTLTKTGAGTLVLLGDNTYTGGTVISAGTLQIGDGAGASTGSITGDVSVATAASLVFKRADTGVAFGGVISGHGSVVQAGTGVVTLSGLNTYDGGTFVTAGTLSVSSANNLGTGAVALSQGSTLKLTASGSFANAVTLDGDPTFNIVPGSVVNWTGVIADSGAPGALPGELEVTGGGTLALWADNTYSGGTVVKGGSTLLLVRDGLTSDGLGAATGGLTLGDATTAGILQTGLADIALSRAITLAAGGGVLDVHAASDTLTISGVISGAGPLTKRGSGTLTLTGTNTYSGGTTITAGTLDIGGGGSTGSIVGNVVDNAALAFDRSDSFGFAGAISGTGTVTKLGAGTLTLTGNNTYTGGTTIAAGDLSVGAGGTTGTLAGNVSVASGSTLIFNRSDATSFAGVVSGAGALTAAGSGALILTGDSTYTGATLINGTLQLGNGGSAGSVGPAAIDDEGVLAINHANTLTLANAISGAGALQQNGIGTTILTAANSYAGGTTITAGTLQLGNGGATGSITGPVTDNATLAFARSDVYTFAGPISGTGAVVQSGSSTTILTANNTYTGPTTVSAGTLQIGNGGTAGAIVGALVDNAAVIFNRSDASTYAGVITGTGTITKLGAGTLTLTGNTTTFSGTTTIAAGTLQLGSGGTSGSLSGAIVDNGTLAFNRSDAVTYSGAISGTGGLAQTGSGTTILTGNSTFAGGTTITAGTLQLGNGGTMGAITGNVADAGTLAFNRSDVMTFAGVISGHGGVAQRGIGTLILTGASSYTGATAVNAGTLLVNGTITSAATVASGATIGGTGTTGTIAVQNGATLAPGVNGAGTLHVAGNLSLSTTSTYAVDASLSATDLTQVSGAAQLGGIVNVTGSGASFSTTPTAIISAASVTGQFADVHATGIGNEIAILSYDATHAYLTISASINSLLPTSTADTNQAHVASAVDFAMQHDGAAGFAPLSSLSVTALDATLSQLAGETGGAIRSSEASVVDDFLDTLLDPNVGGRNGVAGGAALGRQASANTRTARVWGDFHGGRQETTGAAATGSHHLASAGVGAVIGLDYSPGSTRGAIGIAFGIDQQNFKLSDDLGAGHLTSYQVGIYYSRAFWTNYVSLAFEYAAYHAATVRHVSFNGENLYHASFTATDLAGEVEIGRTFEFGSNVLTPFVSLRAQDIGTPDYAESTLAGTPIFALSFTSKQHFDYRSELGSNWDRVLVSDAQSSVGLHTRLGWVHDFSRLIADTATFSLYNGAYFNVRGASPARDAAHLDLGVDYLAGGLSLSLAADGRYAGNANAYGGRLSAAYHW